MKSSLAQSSAMLMRATLRFHKRKRRLPSVFLCFLFFLSACGGASPNQTSAPAQETQVAVTRFVSEPVAADFFAFVTDVRGGELYTIADGGLCRWDGALLEPLFDLAGRSEVKKIAAAEEGIWLECVREGESLPVLELRSYDGELLTEIDLSGLEFVQTWGMLGDLEAGGGLVFADCMENIFVYTADGELKGSVVTERNGAEGIVLTGAGLTVMQSDGDYTNCFDIDPETLEAGKPYRLGRAMLHIYSGGGVYDFVAVDRDALGLWSVECGSGKVEPILLLRDIGLSFEGGFLPYVLGEDDFVLSPVGGGVSMHCFMGDEERPVRQVIRLESLGSVPDLSRYAASFNASQQEYYVEVTDLMSSFPNIDDRLKDLSTRLAAGDGPDIICFNGLDPLPYGRAGTLVDLYELIDSDPELSREDFVALGAFESGDELWSLAPSFTISTCVGLESVVGDGLGWTFEEYLTLRDSLEPGKKMFAITSPLVFVQNTLDGVLPELIDYETASCSFTDGRFEEYLRLASGLETADETDWDSFDARFASGEIVLNEQVLRNIYDLAASEEYYGQALTPIGWPSFDGSCGSRLLITSDMGIVSTGNTDAAWKFLRFVLADEQMQFSIGLNSIPISRKLIEEQLDAFQHPFSEIDPDTVEVSENGGFYSEGVYYDMEYDTSPLMSQRQVNTVLQLLDSISCKYLSNAMVSQIVLEEADVYFAGARSVEDTCAIIQDRASTYIAEQFG